MLSRIHTKEDAMTQYEINILDGRRLVFDMTEAAPRRPVAVVTGNRSSWAVKFRAGLTTSHSSLDAALASAQAR